MPRSRSKSAPPDVETATRAAQYLRMSTEHQKYSIENQAFAISTYAEQHGLTIVRTYQDGGRSGLKISGRPALQQLIADALNGACDFATILVFDVSRWGRFQDVDESAYYEFICKQAGLTVQYCTEQFTNDGSITTALLKSLKRAMAAEYSRELSAKVFAGMCRLAARGYRQGGIPGYGLRRLLIDQHGRPKFFLHTGERKALATDRVILVPGPSEEIATVQRIYRLYVDKELAAPAIAKILNDEGLSYYTEGWTYENVLQVLKNEKYIGNNVYNRRSRKVGQKKEVVNPPELRIRAMACFEPIVSAERFLRAQRIICERTEIRSEHNLLDHLRTLLSREGRLSRSIIDSMKDGPKSASYQRRFGGLRPAYELIGYKQPKAPADTPRGQGGRFIARPKSSASTLMAHNAVKARGWRVRKRARAQLKDALGPD